MLTRSIPFLLCLSLLATGPAKAQDLHIPEAYKWAHNFVSSFAISIYYTGSDSNKLTSDMSQWKYDSLTCMNILWRSLLFGGFINYMEFSYLPDRVKTLTPEQIKRYQTYMAFLATTSSMITYNSRYEEVVVERYNTTKSYFADLGENASAALAGTIVFVRNGVWFYTLPLLLKPFNTWYLSKLPRQQDVANFVFKPVHNALVPVLATIAPAVSSSLGLHPARFQGYGQLAAGALASVVGLVVFSAADLVYKHGLISIKHTLWQFLPTAQDLRVFRFDDCTTCYFGTNIMGKKGYIGSKLRAARDYALSQLESSKKEEL